MMDRIGIFILKGRKKKGMSDKSQVSPKPNKVNNIKS